MSLEFTCIRCVQAFPLSARTVEHIFPYAIGGTLTLNDMCKPCNDRLGNGVDAGLVGHQSMLFPRRNFRLLGRSKREVIPLAGHTVEDPLRRVTAKSDGGYYCEPRYTKTADGLEIRVDPADADRLPTLVARAERSGRSGTVVGIVDTSSYGVCYELTLHATTWIRGLIKIAYELAYRALGAEYVSDPVSTILRTLLINDEDTRDFSSIPDIRLPEDVISSRVFRWLAGPYQYAPRPMSQPRGSWLVGAVCPVLPHGTFSYVRIFDTFEAIVLASERTDWALAMDGTAEIIDVVEGTQRTTSYFEIAMELEAGRHSASRTSSPSGASTV